MWAQISDGFRPNFMDAVVWDLGCGYGDLGHYALENNAAVVYFCDKDWKLVQMAMQKSIDYQDQIFGYSFNINPDTVRWAASHADVGIMTSVLPYLGEPRGVMKAAADFPLLFIECQYSGDGPGLDWIENDQMMGNLIEYAGFFEWAKIGSTTVQDRGAERSIWACGAEGMIF